jgi:hypothetical protein
METKVVKGESIYTIFDGDEKSSTNSFRNASASARASLGYALMRSMQTGREYNIVLTEACDDHGDGVVFTAIEKITFKLLIITASITEVGDDNKYGS